MTAAHGMIGIAVTLFLIIAVIAWPAPPRRPTRTRRGLELVAKDGRLVSVRETESEHEI